MAFITKVNYRVFTHYWILKKRSRILFSKHPHRETDTMKLVTFLLFIFFTQNAWADENVCNGSSVKVQVLGSGGPELTADRASSGYLVWIDEKAKVLVDAGGGTGLRYSQSGAEWTDLDLSLIFALSR